MHLRRRSPSASTRRGSNVARSHRRRSCESWRATCAPKLQRRRKLLRRRSSMTAERVDRTSPTGNHHKAQDCEERATLGFAMQSPPTPTGLHRFPSMMSNADTGNTIRYSRSSATQAVPQIAGCCCVRQWKAPSPQTSSRQSMATTSRSGKHFSRTAIAQASFRSRKTGRRTTLFAI